MADRIAGITVVIDGDTTKLSTALSGVNKQISSTQSQLKDVEKLLKLDPSNTELLTQKQALLKDAVDATKTKLQSLKDAQSQLDASGVEKSSSQYQALQREIIATEESLKGLESQQKAGGATLTAVGNNMVAFGDKATEAGKKLSVVSAGIAAVGAAAVSSWKSMDEGFDTIVTKTGASGDALEGLNDVAKNVYGSMPVEFQDVADAVGDLNTRFGASGDELQNLSTLFLQYANINGQDVSTSIEQVDKIMAAWNIDSSQTANLMGMISAKSQQTGVDVGTLSEAVLTNQSTFKDMGLSVDQSIDLLAQFEANGVDATAAMAGLKKANVNAAKSGTDLKTELGSTIDSIKNASSETEALNIATELFGSKGAAEMVTAIQEGRFSVDDLTDSMGNYGTTVSDTYNNTLDPIDNFTTAMNQMKTVMADIGGTILTALEPAFESLSATIQKIAAWYDGLSEKQQKLVVTIGGIVAAIGPVLIIIGQLSSGIGKGILAIQTIATKIGSLSATVIPALSSAFSFLAANPIVLVIAGIVALVAAIVILWNKNEAFRDAVISIFTAIGDFFTSLKDSIVAIWDGIVAKFNEVSTFLSGVFQVAWQTVMTALQTVFTGFQTAVSTIWTGIQTAFQTFSTWLGSIFSTDWSTKFGLLGNVMNTFFAGIKLIWDNIKTVFSGVISFIQDVFAGNWSGAWNDIVNTFSTIFGNIAQYAKAPINGIISLLNGAISAINVFIRGVNKVLSAISALGISVGQISELNSIAYLAKGGILTSGNAIVGENGPELLSLVNGAARVTPLTNGESGTRKAASGYSQTVNIYAPEQLSPSEVARQTRNATRKLIQGVT